MKNIFVLFMLVFVGCIYADTSVIRVQQIIYDPNIVENKQETVFSLSFWYEMYRTHMILSNWTIKNNIIDNYSDLIFSIKNIVWYNIIDILEFQIDRRWVMENYLNDINFYLLKSDLAIANLKEDISLLNTNKDTCLAQKKILEQEYTDSLYDPSQYEFQQQKIASIKQNAQCISDNEVEYFVKNMYLKKLNAYNEILLIKQEYLEKYKEDIIINFHLLKDDLLEHLLQVKRILEKYDL